MWEEFFGIIWIEVEDESDDRKQEKGDVIGKSKNVISIKKFSLQASSLRTISSESLVL